jgi:hypothetical protein
MYSHLKESICGNIILKSKIQHIRQEGFEPIVEKVHDNVSNNVAIALEKELIAKYGRITNNTGTLCNFTEGGEGTDGYKHRQETRKLFSDMRRGKKQTSAQYHANCNRVVTDEHRLKISAANKGHNWHSEYQFQILKSNEYGAKKFKIILPSGENIEIKNLSRFCKEHGLDRTTATKSATSNTIYKGYQFFRL